jgi:hypothetical protein
MAGEILAEFLRVATNVTKVNRFSTTFQEQKAIETFKQEGRRLMDCAKNGLTLISKLPQEAYEIPSTDDCN